MVIFVILLAVVITVSLVALMQTGPMGIEERFSQAVGLPSGDGHEARGGPVGLSLEGNPMLYAGILSVLGIICIVAYKYGKI